MALQPSSTDARCVRIESCALSAADWTWPLAQTHAPAITADWARRHAEIPTMFNGTVYLQSVILVLRDLRFVATNAGKLVCTKT